MITPKRLFEVTDHQLQHFPKETMLAAKENGQWRSYSTQHVQQTSLQLSAGLLSLGLSGNDFTPEGSDKVAIISNNRPEWIITDLAVQQTGSILVPLYPTTNPLEIEFILNDSKVTTIFISNADLLEKIKSIQSNVPTLKNIFTFNKIEGARHWSELLIKDDAALQRVQTIRAQIPATHLATIIYTSGTTGTPKGVMLSHTNIYSNVMFSKESFPFEDAPHTKVLSFLPLNHIFEKTVTYIYLYSGISIYYAESLETIGDNLKEVQPDGFTTVPRLLEKVFEKIMHTGNQLTGIKRWLFFWAVSLGTQYDNRINKGFWYNTQLAIANRIIFNKWRAALGGNVQYIVTGGAACQVKLLRIFNAAKIPVYEGYGPTENSPVIAVNRKVAGGMKFGTVGPPINGIEVKLADDGEILVNGPCVMVGYYKRPDLTAETVIDGWLHTGDIGVWEDGTFLKITDRKKELFKTSGGKYVAPQPIENKLKENAFIEQVLVVGPERKFVGALIVPAFNRLQSWMKENNIPFTTQQAAIENPKVLEHYNKIIDKYNQLFNHVEQIKKFRLLPVEWSIETGEMTPKMSLRRKIIMEKYAADIEKIYAENNN
ncbi:MAG: long-chain fatty acid--CoA ligase [Sphingobacteriales bacterium]|uniref:AMP-dependent synthetase/ligase n=1 Tax=Hydrotalea flava TaxID=714549 RepID=UPI00082C978B|nr:long-chain fatty acid--CoA ligase [Hydrotalea flava]RTL50009.1 MAG: long-chain fatty acid--CoA ligase [Sphingobacteriales bacterium]